MHFLLGKYGNLKYFYGIGLPSAVNLLRLNSLLEKNDFVILVDEDLKILDYYDDNQLFK